MKRKERRTVATCSWQCQHVRWRVSAVTECLIVLGTLAHSPLPPPPSPPGSLQLLLPLSVFDKQEERRL